MRALPAWLTVAAIAIAPISGDAHAAPRTPLAAPERATLAAIPEDPAPAKIIKDQHYFVSNEVYPERFRKALTDIGGVFVGVGSEQNYFFAGWSKPDILLLMDFDQAIVDLHVVYHAFFRAAPDPTAFIALWGDQAAAQRALQAAATSPAELKRMEWALRQARPFVQNQLQQARKRYSHYKLPTFLTDKDQYESIVELVKTGRVRALRGDLTAKKAMLGIADAAKKLRVPVRGVYLSNVEQYFDYKTQFRANLVAQPYDDKSVVLRTFHLDIEPGDHYRYYVQSGPALRQWLEKSVFNLVKLLEGARPQKKGDTWHIPAPR
jgi:hypothetical protein